MKIFLKNHKKLLLIAGAAVLLIGVSIGATLAWLTASPTPLVNTFVPGEVPCEVWEGSPPTNESGNTPSIGTKQNVSIKNAGNVPAYIRVALVPIWRNADGTGSRWPADELSLTPADSKWSKGNDGYYYYADPVNPLQKTAILISSFTPPSPPSGAATGTYYELQVLAQSIQAEGMGASDAVAAFAKAMNATTTDPAPSPTT